MKHLMFLDPKVHLSREAPMLLIVAAEETLDADVGAEEESDPRERVATMRRRTETTREMINLEEAEAGEASGGDNIVQDTSGAGASKLVMRMVR